MGTPDTKQYKKGARNGLCPKILAGEPRLCTQRYKEVQFTEACSSLVADNSQSIGEPYSLRATTSRVPSSATKTHAAVKCWLTNHLIRTSDINKHCKPHPTLWVIKQYLCSIYNKKIQQVAIMPQVYPLHTAFTMYHVALFPSNMKHYYQQLKSQGYQ